MNSLDDIETIIARDSAGVLQSTGQFCDQCEQAWSEASSCLFPTQYATVDAVVVPGMGGSGFMPRTIKELFADRIKTPYEIIDGYSLPAYVDRKTLVILSSYSGSTEEVLACAQQALAKRASVTAVTAGGRVAQLMKDHDMTAYIFNPRHNPCGQPRIGGGYLFMGHLGLLSALHLIDISDAEVHNAIVHARTVAKTCALGVPAAQNPAKQLALRLKDTHPFIIASEFLRGFANGFANQINETAKMISDHRSIPELNHHLMEGLAHPDTLATNALFLFIASGLFDHRIRKRFILTADVVSKQQIATHTITLKGNTKLAQVLEGFVLSGFTTFYLAMLYDADPVAIPWVNYFKDKLATQ